MYSDLSTNKESSIAYNVFNLGKGIFPSLLFGSFLDKVKATINFEKGTDKVLENCIKAVRRGGTVTVVGVYGTPFDNFPVHRIFDKGLTLRTGQAPVHKYIDELISLVESGKVVLNDILTHQLPLTEAVHVYDIFKHKEDNCVKVIA